MIKDCCFKVSMQRDLAMRRGVVVQGFTLEADILFYCSVKVRTLSQAIFEI
jgi:hypothetical protein